MVALHPDADLVKRLAVKIRRNYLISLSLTSIPSGSESILVDPNLQTFLQCIVDINKDDARK
jgi:hypothetical protein